MAVAIEGLKEMQAALRAADLKREMSAASKQVGNDLAASIKSAAPRRSGRLGESTRAGARQDGVTIMIGGGGVPYAGPIIYGWSSRPNKRKGWRGGPIRPNPYPYEVVDREADNIRERYVEQLNRLSEGLSSG